MSTSQNHEILEQTERLERLIHDVERLTDPDARAHAKELVQAMLDYHGAALTRLVEQIVASGAAGQAMIESCAGDELVSSLLLLYGLHPLDLQTRVENALEQVRPYLRSHGGNVELLGVREGVVGLRMQGSCDGCPSSAMTLKLAIEAAIHAAAPDVAAIEVEGIVDAAPSAIIEIAPLPRPGDRRVRIEHGEKGWEEADGLAV